MDHLQQSTQHYTVTREKKPTKNLRVHFQQHEQTYSSALDDQLNYQSLHSSDSERQQSKDISSRYTSSSSLSVIKEKHLTENLKINPELDSLFQLRQEAEKIYKESNRKNLTLMAAAKDLYMKCYKLCCEKQFEETSDKELCANLSRYCLIRTIHIAIKSESYHEALDLSLDFDLIGFKDARQEDDLLQMIAVVYNKLGNHNKALELLFKIQVKDDNVRKEIQRTEYQIQSEKQLLKRRAQLRSSINYSIATSDNSQQSQLMVSHLPISNKKLNDEETNALVLKLSLDKEEAQERTPQKKSGATNSRNYTIIGGSFALMACGLILYRYLK